MKAGGALGAVVVVAALAMLLSGCGLIGASAPGSSGGDLEREREERRRKRAGADRLEDELRDARVEARRSWWQRMFGG